MSSARNARLASFIEQSFPLWRTSPKHDDIFMVFRDEGQTNICDPTVMQVSRWAYRLDMNCEATSN